MFSCIFKSFLMTNRPYFKSFQKQPPEVSLGKDVLKPCGKFTGEHRCRSAISIKLQRNFVEITLWHESSPVNLLHIFRTPFLKALCYFQFLKTTKYVNQILSAKAMRIMWWNDALLYSFTFFSTMLYASIRLL